MGAVVSASNDPIAPQLHNIFVGNSSVLGLIQKHGVNVQQVLNTFTSMLQ